MSELNVPGIKSELILGLEKWIEPFKRALSDSKVLGTELEKGLAAASRAATDALAKTGHEADDLAKAAAAAAKEADALAKANSAIKPPSLPAPTNVINWGQGLRSLAGIAGTVSPALGQMVSGFTAIEGAAAAAGISLTAALGPIALVVAALAGAKAAFSFGLEGVKLAADMEQTALSFEVMIGSADQAKKTLDDLKQFAATTPFEFPEIANAGKQLLAMGIEAKDLTTTLRMLGDVGSGLGQPLGEMAYLFGQMRSQGRAMTQDLNQFAARGVPIYRELAKILGTTEVGVRELAASGEISFDLINQAFKGMTGEGGKFYEMTARQSTTLNGLLSTLSDGWNEIKRQVGEAIIQGLDVKEVVKQVTAAVEMLAPMIVGTFSSAVQWMQATFKETEPIRGAFAEMASLIANLSKTMDDTFGVSFVDLLKAALLPLRAIETVIEAIFGGIRDMLKWLNEAIEAVSFLNSDKMTAEMNKNSRGWTKEERAEAARKAQAKAGGSAPAPPAGSPPVAADWETQMRQSRERAAQAAAGGSFGPPVAPAAAQRTQALNTGTATAAAPRAASGGGGGITVNAPAIDLEKLGMVLAKNVIPFIDQRIAAIDRRTQLEQYSGKVRRGI